MSPRIEAAWLGGAQLAQLFNVTTMTIWRWERDPKLNFPTPKFINNRKFWARQDIDNWMRHRAGSYVASPAIKKPPAAARRRQTVEA
jgi:predicted DNA-binding transcriptional regulator AlpA